MPIEQIVRIPGEQKTGKEARQRSSWKNHRNRESSFGINFEIVNRVAIVFEQTMINNDYIHHKDSEERIRFMGLPAIGKQLKASYR